MSCISESNLEDFKASTKNNEKRQSTCPKRKTVLLNSQNVPKRFQERKKQEAVSWVNNNVQKCIIMLLNEP